jgi:ABC-type multidrug transport system fused ATPase/permease subunit
VGTFVNVFYDVVDESSSALVNFVSAQRWLGLRIEVLGSSIVLCNCLLVICLNDVLGLEPGILALLIIWASNFTTTLGRVVDAFADGEAAITSMERVHAMVSIAHEKPMTNTASKELSSSWPDQGLLEFQDVCLRYREGLPLALDKLSFTIPPGARCGVVGRTGAGEFNGWMDGCVIE